MQITMRVARPGKNWRSLLLRKKIKPVSKDVSYVEMFWKIQEKAYNLKKNLFQSYKKS